MNEIVQLISSVGFPIVMTLILIYYIMDTQEKMVSSINNLTHTVNKLNERIDLILSNRITVTGGEQTKNEDNWYITLELYRPLQYWF